MVDKLKNWDFIGRCYNVLKVDPLNIEKGAKGKMAFLLDEFNEVADSSAQKPICTEHTSRSGGESKSNTVSMSSSHDFRTFNKLEASVTVSDPTGEMFSTSLSQSYEKTRNETESHEKVTTYATLTAPVYNLSLIGDEKDGRLVPAASPKLKVSTDLASSVAGLPTTSGTLYKQFVRDFGTHYAREVLFGGRIYQRLTVENAEYSTFLEEGLDVSAQATATFEIAKAGVKGGVQDKRSDKFVNAVKNSTEEIQASGGKWKKDFDSWSDSVKEAPTAIQVNLHPLYELLAAEFFPDDRDIATKQTLLKKEIDDYLTKDGHDVEKDVLHYGDQVVLFLVAKGPERYLSAADRYARTSQQSLEAGQPGHDDNSLRWIIVQADAPDSRAKVQMGDLVALRSVGRGKYLDAQDGADENYDKGVGLTAASGAKPSQQTTQWKLVLADNRKAEVRLNLGKEIVDGDYVRLQSQWLAPDEQSLGYLQSDFRDAAQRVFSFGGKSGPGTIWRMSRR